MNFYWPIVVRGLHLLPRHALPRVGAGADELELQPARARPSRWWRWVAGSYLLRWVLTVTAADSKSIYGPLAAPIAVLLWLYLVAIAVLIGAAVNAAFDTVFPQKSTVRARLKQVAAACGSGSTPARRPPERGRVHGCGRPVHYIRHRARRPQPRRRGRLSG